jgi:hypothetical protein
MPQYPYASVKDSGKLIDTVFYRATDNVTVDEVRRSLIEHDGYNPFILVVERT